MNRRTYLITFLALLVGGGISRAEEPAKEAVSLDGTWKVVALTSGVEEAPTEAFQMWRWEIKGKKLMIFGDGEEQVEIVMVLDASKSPGAIDLTSLTGDMKGKTVKGIFELKQEKLRICLGGPGVDGPRPTELVSRPGNGLITLERIKKP